MATRTINTQSIHDAVIRFAASHFDLTNHDVFINPGIEHNAWIGNNYPDIILVKKDSTTVEFIIEVETADSVNIVEASNQWKKYATEIKASFYLLVPLAQKNAAINLCKQVGISARFGTYQTDIWDNVISVNYE